MDTTPSQTEVEFGGAWRCWVGARLAALLVSKAAMSGRSSPTSSLGQPAAADGSSSSSSSFPTTAVVAAAVKLAGRKRQSGGEHVNIKVAVRARPLGEGLKGDGTLLFDGETQLSLVHPHGGQRSDFSFDHVYGPRATQAQLYDDLGRQILDCAFEGYNGTIFAYGQTGTGKTFTMEGMNDPPELRGIIPRAFAQIFEQIVSRGSEATEFLVRASYLEIYNEELTDLLVELPVTLKKAPIKPPPAGDKTPREQGLVVMEDKGTLTKPGRGMFVHGLSEHTVSWSAVETPRIGPTLQASAPQPRTAALEA